MAVDTEDKKKIYNTEYELKENSQVILKITIPKEEVKKEYTLLVNDYCKNIQIKGFRKGKVPPNVLERKFGDSIKAESAQKLIEKALEYAFETTEHKPLPYAQPELTNKSEYEIEKDFSFEITYDSYPNIVLGEYKKLEIKKMVPDISNKDLENELTIIQEQNAMFLEKKNGIVEKDNSVTIDYIEVDDDGKEIEQTKREGFSFTVGSGYNLHKIDDDIIGMKKDGEKIIEKKYPEDFENKDLAGKSVHLKVKIQAIKEKKIPELDDELAQDVSDKYKTLEDLKNDIKEKLKQNAENKVKEHMISQIIEKVVTSSTIPLPKSMVESELEMRWHRFMHQYHANEDLVIKELEKQGKTKENIIEEWKPKVEEGIRSALAVEKMVSEEKIEVSEEDLSKEMENISQSQNIAIEDVKKYYEKKNFLDELKMMISRQKLFDSLVSMADIKKGKKVKYLDLMQDNY